VGSIERAFTGYVALPEKAGGLSWWDVLGVPINATEEQVTSAYRAKAKIFHPDSGSAPDHEAMVKLNEAYTMATSQKVAA
jgi:DnaJ-class molecular chaperone